MSELIGPGRDRHTEEFAETLREDENIEQSTIVEERTDVDVGKGEEDDLQIVAPRSTVEFQETIENDDLIEVVNEIESDVTPVLELKDVNTIKDVASTDDVEIKKEEIEDPKRLIFNEEEDNYIKDGYVKYAKSLTKWADILKDPAYKFHPSRKRDTLRCRYNTLQGGKRDKQGNKRKRRSTESIN